MCVQLDLIFQIAMIGYTYNASQNSSCSYCNKFLAIALSVADRSSFFLFFFFFLIRKKTAKVIQNTLHDVVHPFNMTYEEW